MPPSVDDVSGVVAAFLQAAQQALALTAAGTPGRVYASAGRPAFDCCGQLTAWASFLAEGDTQSGAGGLAGSKKARIGKYPVITVTIQATRCAALPTGRPPDQAPPTPAALQAVAAQTNEDVWALYLYIAQDLRDGDLHEACGGSWFDGATPINEQGGCVGWELVYRYPIPGGIIST
jgi:hypothetical protein